MIGRTDHYLAAQGNLSDARHFATEAGIRPPREEEALSLQWAQVHALLAIGDALRDRLDPGLLRGLERMNDVLSQLGARGPITGDTEPDSEPDPLDENDHRDRLAADRLRIVRCGRGHWHTPAIGGTWCDADCTEMSLRDWAHRVGPLAFAPDADGAPSVTAPVTDDPADDAEGGSESQRRNLNAQTDVLCPNCGHDIDVHALQGDGMRCRSWHTDCQCDWWPSWIAARLIRQAVKEAAQ